MLLWSAERFIHGASFAASHFGISPLFIGMFIIGISASLPELISSIIAVRKNEHELAVGNVVGSNLFNTLAVIGLAGIIQPLQVEQSFLYRDGLLLLGLTVALLIFCLGIKGPGKITRLEGSALLICFIAYNGYLAQSIV